MPKLHPSTFEYLKPTQMQIDRMAVARAATAAYAATLEDVLPEGPDKTYAIRKVREVGMWANVAITRQADGTPLTDEPEAAIEANPMPPIHVGQVFAQFHPAMNRTVTTDERGNELEAVGPHWYDKNALDRWRNPEAVPTPPIEITKDDQDGLDV